MRDTAGPDAGAVGRLYKEKDSIWTSRSGSDG